MTFRTIATGAVVAALALGQADRAQADAGDFVAGAIIGGIVGGAIAKDAQKRKSTKKTTYSNAGKKPSVSSAQREANREVQTALNYWGYPVGTPDGAIGPKTRAAITEFQITMGWPGTGELNEFEREFLVSAYQRAQIGGATTAALITQNPMGAKGLLLAWRDERLGVQPGVAGAPLNPFAPAPAGATAQAPSNPFAKPAPAAAGAVLAGTTPAAPAPAPLVPAPVVTPPSPLPTFAAAAPVLPAPAPAAGAAAALPSFMAAAPEAQVSLASHCSKVSLVTNSNGGFVTQVSMTDPAFALSEQFCLARTYGIAQGEDLTAKVAGFSAAQIADQCAAFAPLLSAYVDAVGIKGRDEVLAEVGGFVAGAGMAPSQLAGTAKICLGVGYTTDDMGIALGSALLLSALGERSYGELVGHHLAQGIGTARRPDLALAWYEGALGSEGEEVVSVFAPGMTDRSGLIRMAAYAVADVPLPGGAVADAPQPQPASQPVEADGGGGFGLPFKLPYIGGNSANP